MNGHDSIILAAGSNVVTSALDLFSQFAIIGGGLWAVWAVYAARDLHKDGAVITAKGDKLAGSGFDSEKFGGDLFTLDYKDGTAVITATDAYRALVSADVEHENDWTAYIHGRAQILSLPGRAQGPHRYRLCFLLCDGAGFDSRRGHAAGTPSRAPWKPERGGRPDPNEVGSGLPPLSLAHRTVGHRTPANPDETRVTRQGEDQEKSAGDMRPVSADGDSRSLGRKS